jgi:hypothetical protein
MKYRVEQIMEIKDTLAALPEVTIERKEFVNSQEAVTLMSDVLGDMQKKGYSIDMIAKLLNEQGIDISLSTLRRYLHRAGNQRQLKRVKTRKPKLEKSATALKECAPAGSPQECEPERKGPKAGFAIRGDTKDL